MLLGWCFVGDTAETSRGFHVGSASFKAHQYHTARGLRHAAPVCAGDHESAKATFPLVPTHYEKAGKWHPKTEGEVRVPALKCRALQLKLQEEVHAAASG